MAALNEIARKIEWPAERIRQLRYRLGLTQEEFAQQIGVTVSTANRWENSKMQPCKLVRKALRQLDVISPSEDVIE